MAEMEDWGYSDPSRPPHKMMLVEAPREPKISIDRRFDTNQTIVYITDGKRRVAQAFDLPEDAKHWVELGFAMEAWQAAQDVEIKLVFSKDTDQWTLTTSLDTQIYPDYARDEVLQSLQEQLKRLVPEVPRPILKTQPTDYGTW